MITLYKQGAYLVDGKRTVPEEATEAAIYSPREAAKNTMTHQILAAHNRAKSDSNEYRLFFDALASHDITYVGIVQTARASGLERFPLPYVLTNCHNSLCAVGGTINADDHVFGLSAAQKYGGIYVPPHMAVIHQYMREKMTRCGGMILGSDSHTRYGALGTMGFGEGGGELVKQLLGRSYDISSPDVVGVYLTGAPSKGVGPQDVALSIIGAVFENGYVKNKVMEFVGEGISQLSMDFRNGIDVMTTETACLSSVWVTDEAVEEFYSLHGRPESYKKLQPGNIAYYDGFIEVDLSKIKPMMALPYHPSRVFSIEDVLQYGAELWPSEFRDKISKSGLSMDQGIIAGCAGGTYENICEAAAILDGHDVGCGAFGLNVYPASQPIQLALTENGVAARLMRAGVMIKTAFCGPCFGAGDVPCNNGLGIRHTTRNFPNREGSKPGAGQNAAVALMDARSIAATARNGGVLTAATDYADSPHPRYFFDGSLYARRVFSGPADEAKALVLGPGIKDWPAMEPLKRDMLMQVASFITDPVTTTDELIPSGETSSYRSNPEALAEFTLSRKDPGYVTRAKTYKQRNESLFAEIQKHFPSFDPEQANIGSLIYALKPGDGSAREQAASCQRVLGGLANIAAEYATKRYRSNLVNWGLLPFIFSEKPPFALEDIIYIPDIRKAIEAGETEITAYVLKKEPEAFTLSLPGLTKEEAVVLLSGCLINLYSNAKTCTSTIANRLAAFN